MLIDQFNRQLNYMRISITDRCNYRCVYCMPAEGITARPHTDILTFEEIRDIVKVSAAMGISRLRLTGGEPLVRRNVTDLVRMLAVIPGIEEISLTSNGHLLEELALPLAEAGLNRINVSLDTLDPILFRRITRGGSLEKVLRGLQAAEEAGLQPVKINCVVVRGVNDEEIQQVANLTLDHPWQVRFIEFMPVENGQDWGLDFPEAQNRYISIKDIRGLLGNIQPVEDNKVAGSGPARIFRIAGAEGTIGFISPVSEHFCGECNRLRLTADGNLKPCLLHSSEIPLRDSLRQGQDISPLIEEAVRIKPLGHNLKDRLPETKRTMSQIGG